MLTTNLTSGAKITPVRLNCWRLQIPSGAKGQYRLAQLDDYRNLKRRTFPWHPPLTVQLRARASSNTIPGTWGFGLWNDPFSLSLGFGGGIRRLPSLPNTAWFFFASPPNYLSLRDDLPAQGNLAATFQSPHLPPAALAFLLPLLPLLALPLFAQTFRRLGRGLIHQDAASFSISPINWHTYQLEWHDDHTVFRVDNDLVLETDITPQSPLGLVIWIDNQYAALPPDGNLKFGTLHHPTSPWIEIDNVLINDRIVSINDPPPDL